MEGVLFQNVILAVWATVMDSVKLSITIISLRGDLSYLPAFVVVCMLFVYVNKHLCSWSLDAENMGERSEIYSTLSLVKVWLSSGYKTSS